MAYLIALKQSAEPIAPPTVESANIAFSDHETSMKAYQGIEKRQSPRYKCDGKVEMCQAGSDASVWASFNDISLHGCFVDVPATYPVGTSLQMKLEAAGRTIETSGTVKVNYPHLGMGVIFVAMDEESCKQLKDLLASISRPSVIMGAGLAANLPAHATLESMPLISDHAAAVQALVNFFENRQMLMRDDFIRVVRQSQANSGNDSSR